MKNLTVISQKRIKDSNQWHDTPWISQEKPTWFTLAPPFREPRKNPVHFGFLSSNDQTAQGVLLSQPPIHPPQFPQHSRPQRENRPAIKPKPKTSSRLSVVSYKNNWLDKELFFAMNKLSIVGMVAGLMFLGALFFISGFLLALNLYVLPNHQLPATALAAPVPHRASPNALAATHKPTPTHPATVPHQYANVGGVAMTNPPHKPTQMPVQQYPQPVYGQQPQPQAPYQQQPVYQPQPSAPTPYPDARYGQQQPTYAQPQYAPPYSPPYQPTANQ